jgi:TolB protein
MSSSVRHTGQARRASDRVQQQMRARWITAVGVTGIAVVLQLGADWWRRAADPARDGAPSWAPDGKAIVFSAEVGAGKGDIYVMREDGSQRRNLTNSLDANDASPTMSPDGRTIAFESDRGGNVDIYVMDRAGGNVRRLTTDPADDRSPAWSPDGSRIAFTSTRGQRDGADLYVMSAGGGNVQRLTTGGHVWAPQYSRDGHSIAVQMDRDVYVIDAITQTARRITADPDNGMNPTWSPDGQQLAFVTTRNRQAELFTVNSNGTDAKAVVSLPSGAAIDPRWSPDGTKIVFVLVPQGPESNEGARRDVQAIYTVDLASGTLTRLSR